ncbi:MAG: glycosyltransferase [Phycisphaerae bacterium]
MISILTVNFHSAADVAGLAAALAPDRAAAALELIVVNHSPREPLALPPDWAGASRVIDQQNRGFAAGINAAARVARGETLAIVNPDVRLGVAALQAAERFLADHPDVGVVAPRLLYPDGRVQPSVRRFYSWSTALWARSPMRMAGWEPAFFRDYLRPAVSETGPSDVDWAMGAALFLRRADYPSGEIFDERFFLYFEDVDLCYRAWRAGRRVVHCPHITAVHAHRRRSARPFGRHGRYHLTSWLKFMLKHGGLPGRPGG